LLRQPLSRRTHATVCRPLTPAIQPSEVPIPLNSGGDKITSPPPKPRSGTAAPSEKLLTFQTLTLDQSRGKNLAHPFPHAQHAGPAPRRLVRPVAAE
jgi:hypothetical protein